MKMHGLATRLLAVPAALRTLPGQSKVAAPVRITLWDVRGAPPAPRVRAMAMASSAPSATQQMPPFHLAFPVNDLAASKDFYGRCATCTRPDSGHAGDSLPRYVQLGLTQRRARMHTDVCYICFLKGGMAR